MTQPTVYGDGVAVVVVTYFPGETLEPFLQTLEKASTRDVRVVLADNASTDGAPEKAAAAHDNVHLLSIGENLGYGSAANRGVAELGPEYGWVVVVNPDLEWGPGSLDTLLEAARRWPRGGAFGPLIREPDGAVYPSARLLPELGRGIGHAVFGKVWPANPWTRAYRQERGEPVERLSGWLSGSCQLLRREAFDSVDGFDSRYFMYFEDVDLGDRLARAGWQNVYAPSAEVMHIGGKATSRAPAKMLAAHHVSAYRYLSDRHRGLLWKPVLAAIKLGLKARLKLETR
ncbi:glycosyltransferase family 2 protein [Amycolatopsis minnesotensis]|uniref:Glycosyltransferase family 2 protein n=1 Tax=Amycolatopsis minnesotensis TaxID=337894 RepID=A0ABN2SJP4_9PSEU